MRRPTTSELELLALGGVAMGVCYAFASPEFAGAVAWNVGSRAACRLYNNYYAKDNAGLKHNEYIQARMCEVPVNVASTTFLSAGINTFLQGQAQGFDVTSVAVSILAKSIAYGIVGQIFKDAAAALVDLVMPLDESLKGKEPKKKKSKKSEKSIFDELKYAQRCFNSFCVQHTKFSINPSAITGIQTLGQHVFTGAARHTMNHFLNQDYKTAIDAFAMGALNFTTYLLPKFLIPDPYASSYFVKSAYIVGIETAERCAATYFKKAPITGRFSQQHAVDSKKQR